MISLKHKYIFLHIPKCGGSSVEQVLLQNELSLSDKIFDDPFWIDNLSKEIKSKFILGKDIGLKSHKCNKDQHSFSSQHFAMVDYIINFPEYQKDFFKFTFVRNPYSKVVSEWKYFLKIDPKYNFNFRDSITNTEYWGRCYPYEEHNWYQKIYADGCDFIGKFENLQEDFNIVCDKIGIPKKKLPHKNKGDYSHYTEYYDNETRKIVAEKYARDIEYFGYEFGE